MLGHRRHIDSELKAARSGHSLELREVVKRFDKVIVLLEAHLKQAPESPLTLDWLRELRELRVTISARAKLMVKAAPSVESPRREGDKFNVIFVSPDGKPIEIPLAVYRALPAFKNGAEGDEQSRPDCNNGSKEKTSGEPVTMESLRSAETAQKGGKP